MNRILPLIFFLVVGCYQAVPPVTTLSEGQERLIEIAANEHNMDITLIPRENTLHIFLPVNDTLFTFKATPKQPPMAAKYQNMLNIKHLDVSYEDHHFYIDYHVATERAYPTEPKGYTSGYSQEFQQKQRDLLSAVTRAFGDLTGEDREPPPDFIVVTMADTRSGIYLRTTFYFPDYKRATLGELPYDEYSLRILYDIKGSQSLIDDVDGSSLNYPAVTWPDFMARLMKNRIQSTLGKQQNPETNVEQIIREQAALTLDYYTFEGYDNVILRDLQNQSTDTLQREHLNDIRRAIDQGGENSGRLINLRFNYDPDKGVSIEEVDEQAVDQPQEKNAELGTGLDTGVGQQQNNTTGMGF